MVIVPHNSLVSRIQGSLAVFVLWEADLYKGHSFDSKNYFWVIFRSAALYRKKCWSVWLWSTNCHNRPHMKICFFFWLLNPLAGHCAIYPIIVWYSNRGPPYLSHAAIIIFVPLFEYNRYCSSDKRKKTTYYQKTFLSNDNFEKIFLTSETIFGCHERKCLKDLRRNL